MEKEYPPGSKGAVLVRVSSIKQVEEGHSLEEQEERAIAKAVSLGLEVPEEYIFRIEGESAFKIPPKGRKVYEKMMKALEQDDDLVAVVCWKRDRVWRNHVEMTGFNEDIDRFGKDVIYYGDAPRQDTSIASGWLMENMLALLPEFESRLTSERVPPGQERSKQNGYHFGKVNALFWKTILEHPDAIGLDGRRGSGLLVPTGFMRAIAEDRDDGLSYNQLWEKYGPEMRKHQQGIDTFKAQLRKYERWKFDPIHGDATDDSVLKKKGGFVRTIGSKKPSKRKNFMTAIQKEKRNKLLEAIRQDRAHLEETGELLYRTQTDLATVAGYARRYVQSLNKQGVVDLTYRTKAGPKKRS